MLTENAIMPTHENHNDAGYDIYSSEEKVIKPKSRELIGTGVKWEPIIEPFEKTYFDMLGLSVYADIRDRSGNALKKGLTVLGGIVDFDYRGEIKVILYNTSEEDIVISKHDKIAQIIFTPCIIARQIENVQEVSQTKRGSNGFGSSGVAGNEYIGKTMS